MEAVAATLALVVIVTAAYLVIAIEQWANASDEFDGQPEREAELLRKTRMEIEA